MAEARKLAYRPPATQADRLAEAEGHIRNITASMNQGSNRFGQYGQSCRESITRWEATATDARAKIAAGWVTLLPPEHERQADAREAADIARRRAQAAWLRSQGHTWATARALPKAGQAALQTRWAAFLAAEKGE